MNVERFAWRVVRWEYAPGAFAAGTDGAATREVVLLEVRTRAGAIALGEAAPLPGRSRDSIADVLAAFEGLRARDVRSADDALRAAREIDAPAARFAVETALLGALAAETGVDLARLIADTAPREIATAIVVGSADEARRAWERGARCLKVKMGDAAAIAAAAPGARLRLDANRAWPAPEVAARLEALAALPIDFVEEPCADLASLLGTRLALPIALDETLADASAAELDALLAWSAIGALVVKPTVLGGIARCRELAARVDRPVIVSHALEGPVGTAACAELARALAGDCVRGHVRAAGLGAHPALADWSFAPPQLAGATVRRAASAGLGFGARDLASAAAPLPMPEDDALSIFAAAGDSPGHPAILHDGGVLSFADVAALAGDAASARTIIAHPGIATLVAVYRALAQREPLALIHHRLAGGEQQRQRVAAEAGALDHDTAFVLFTSGSTADARGVVLSRAAIVAAARASATHLGWREDDRWLLDLSLAHAGGLSIAVRCLIARRPIALGWAARPTLASLVPTQLAALLDDPAWAPPPELRAVLLGGAAAPPALLAAARARGVPIRTTYGLTETFGQVATARDAASAPTSLPGVTILAGTADAPARIHVRGPMLATRYLDGAPIAPALATADLGHVDDAGALHIAGRADDVIITGGENVHPAAVEAVLATTPGVRAALAFGVADARWGQLVAAALAIDPAAFTLAAATAHWRAALPAYALPRRLALVAALPQLATGKLDRRAATALPSEPIHYALPSAP